MPNVAPSLYIYPWNLLSKPALKIFRFKRYRSLCVFLFPLITGSGSYHYEDDEPSRDGEASSNKEELQDDGKASSDSEELLDWSGIGACLPTIPRKMMTNGSNISILKLLLSLDPSFICDRVPCCGQELLICCQP